ncbi:MAG: hypothetical protein HY084_12610 [Gemmatimonadetes bacterium]|nr:hypothetical protein [Gemmatimonadota bacterium]
MRRSAVSFARLASLLALAAAPLVAQGDPSAAKPGRASDQPIDQEYTKKILEYTTEKFFLSPLVDYLPASKTVPTPKAVLGDIAGAPTKLPYSHEVYAYMRLLAKASPRVKVVSIGTTEEGREMIAVAVASERLIARLDENRAKLAKLGDPRSIGMNDAEAERIAADATPIYYVTGTIHSPETGAPTALMELAYRLAVDESPYIRNIRDHVVTLITPIVEVDGRDRQVDIFNWHMKHPGETYPNLLYWGHYVAHDNNRDAMGMTLKLTQNVLNTYVDWKVQVLHDLHESVAFLYDNTVGDGPYNAWLDPLLTNEWQMMGWNNVQEMTRMGMPGVFAHGQFDTWSPGYLMFIAATHNGISRLYETFGNGGTAETVDRTLSPSETERTWYRQNPPLPRVKWSLRNNNNYEQTGVLVSLSYFANNRRLFLWNFYEKSKRSILKAHTEGPAAYVFTANDPRPGAQAELLRILQKQRVEISRATAPFSATLPVKRAAAGGRGGRGGAAPAGEPSAPVAPETRQFPAGSYIVRMDQPYSRIADALLDYQYWSPNDPQKTPYDDTGWTFPEGFDVKAVRVTDPKILDVPMEPVTGEVKSPGGVTGTGDVYAINANGDNGLASLRYALPSADFQSAEEPFEAGGVKYARGSFLVSGVARDALDKAAVTFGVRAVALASAPSVKTHPARAARVAVLHTWTSSTQTEGWWRMALDFNQIPFTYISTQEIAKDAALNAKYDVILFPPTQPQTIVDGMPMWRNPMPWKNTPDTPNLGTWAQTDDMRPGLGLTGLANLRAFVANGGVLVTSIGTSDFAVQNGLATGVGTVAMPRGKVVGSLLRSKIVDDASPIVYGVSDNLAVYSDAGEAFTVSAARGGGFGGRFGGGNGVRATGRGQADDADEVQGRPALEPRFQAPPRVPVQPWQYAPITDDQLRNPLNVIPPDQRPRVALRFSEQRDLLVSGLLDGGGEIAQRPAVVDVPMQKGHVVLFANNPVWRGETLGSYAMVFNVLLHFDHLDAGRKLDPR